MEKFTIRVEVIFIIILIAVLSVFTIFKIKSNYHLSPLTVTNKNLNLIRKSIDEFYIKYNRFPTEEEINSIDEDSLFTSILKNNLKSGFSISNDFEFPKTPSYIKKVDGIPVEIEESNNIKIADKIENLGLDNSLFSSNGGWIYSPLNGEIRANLQTYVAKDKLKDPSRPSWGRKIDWYYK